MTFRVLTSSLRMRRGLSRALIVGAIALLVSVTTTTTDAYVLNGKSWASGTIVMQLGLGSAGRTLTDGNTSWNAAAAPALDAWNQQIGRVQFSGVMNSPAPLSSGDRINTVGFSGSVFGQSFGSGTLAVTYYIMQGSSMIEADVLFNTAQTFDSYRGPLHFGSSGYATADIRRVLLHELGHALGLNHASGDVIMNALTSDREVLASDDIAGAQSMYGAPLVVNPTPAPATSSLVSISTRMRVGLNDDVLIGGFTIKGTQPKTLLLRGIGPALTQFGVNGALQDPLLELHDASGALIAQNDNWQTAANAALVQASGKAPPSPAEAALLVTLNPGSYTAIIRGANNTQGVALVEGYEMDAPATRMVGISTRGRIGLADEVMIGGFAVQGSAGKRVIVRGLGPSLASLVSGVIADPILEIHDSNGGLIAVNDDWPNSAQASEITSSGQAPAHALDSAIIATLAPGSYTAIVRGVDGATGVGLVDVYDLDP